MFCRHSKVQVRQNLRLTLNLNHHTKYPATTTTAKNAQTLKRRSHTTDDNAANATATAAQQTILAVAIKLPTPLQPSALSS
jgi:hypothetical protein